LIAGSGSINSLIVGSGDIGQSFLNCTTKSCIYSLYRFIAVNKREIPIFPNRLHQCEQVWTVCIYSLYWFIAVNKREIPIFSNRLHQCDQLWTVADSPEYNPNW